MRVERRSRMGWSPSSSPSSRSTARDRSRTAPCSGTPRRPSRSSATWRSRSCSRSSWPSGRVVASVSSTRWLERIVWRWYLSTGGARRGLRRRTRARVWLRYRLRIGDAPARGAVLHSGGALAQPGGGPAGGGRDRGDRAGLGHELVLRYRELGVGHLELLGGSANRPLARSDGPRRGRTRGRRRDHLRGSPPGRNRETSASSSSATPAKATRRSMRCAISC